MTMWWVRACYNGECWMSALLSSEAAALQAAAEWFLIPNVDFVEVERQGA